CLDPSSPPSASPVRIHSSPDSTASRSRKTPEETGKGTIRSSAPSNSISEVVAGFSPRVRSDFGSSLASLIAQPVALGPKGAGSSAVSGISQGRVTPLKDRSNACWLYAGSKVRSERKAMYFPSRVNVGQGLLYLPV